MTEEAFQRRLLALTKRYRFIYLEKKHRNVAVVSGAKMDRELSEVPFRNSFRPVIVFRWGGNSEGTLLEGFCRLSRSILWVSALFPIIGIVQAFRYHTIYPVLFFAALWIVVFQLLGYLLFLKEYEWVKGNFEILLNDQLHTTERL